MRDLFANTGWREQGAKLAILRLVYAAGVDNGQIWVPSGAHAQDADERRQKVGPPRHYVTRLTVSQPRYTESVD